MEVIGLMSKLDTIARELHRIGDALEKVAENQTKAIEVSATLETADDNVLRALDPCTGTEKVIAHEVDGKENIFRITLIGVNALGHEDMGQLQRLRDYVVQHGRQQNYTENGIAGVDGLVPKLSYITVTGSWLKEHEVDEGFFYVIDGYKWYIGGEMTFLGRRSVTSADSN